LADAVWGFFYGGLINPNVMDRVGFHPTARSGRAWLPSYDIIISPLVNLIPREGAVAFGQLLRSTHDELTHVYGQLQARYFPYPVLAYDEEARAVPALCYLLPHVQAGQADADHVNNLLQPATALGFPEWYLEKIRSFLPPKG
jgi:hypothetical protein